MQNAMWSSLVRHTGAESGASMTVTLVTDIAKSGKCRNAGSVAKKRQKSDSDHRPKEPKACEQHLAKVGDAKLESNTVYSI